MPHQVTALVAGIMLCGCASPEPAPEPSCGFEAQFPQLIALLQSPEMQPVVDFVQSRLLDTGLLQPAVSSVIATMQAVPVPPAMVKESLTSGSVSSGPSLPRSLALYVVGDAPANKAHYDVPNAIGATLSQCRELIVLADEFLTTPVPAGCSLTDAGCDLAWHALIVAVRELVATPSLRDTLARTDGSGLSEETFMTIIQTFTGFFKSTKRDFSDVNMFAQTHVLPRLADPQLRDALQNVLTTLEQVLAPEVGIQAALASSLACFESNDPESSVYHMLYALLGNSGFQTTEIVSSTPAPDNATVAWVGQLAQYLRTHDAAKEALTRAIATVLDEANISVVLPVLLHAADTGTFDHSSTLLTPQPCP